MKKDYLEFNDGQVVMTPDGLGEVWLSQETNDYEVVVCLAKNLPYAGMPAKLYPIGSLKLVCNHCAKDIPSINLAYSGKGIGEFYCSKDCAHKSWQLQQCNVTQGECDECWWEYWRKAMEEFISQ
jgi:hypothetical protein